MRLLLIVAVSSSTTRYPRIPLHPRLTLANPFLSISVFSCRTLMGFFMLPHVVSFASISEGVKKSTVRVSGFESLHRMSPWPYDSWANRLFMCRNKSINSYYIYMRKWNRIQHPKVFVLSDATLIKLYIMDFRSFIW